MKKDSNNTYDNMVDFNQYINPDNELSEEMLQAYLEATDMETPDLWSRIDAGYDSEVIEINNEKNLNKKRNKKFIAFIAAAFLITLIALPIVMLGGSRDAETENIKDEHIAFDEAVEESAAADMDVAEESVEESEMVMEDAPAEDTQAEANNESVIVSDAAENPTESAPTDSQEEMVSASEGFITEEVSVYKAFLYYDGKECYIYVIDKNNAEFFDKDDRILINNKEEILSLIDDGTIIIDEYGCSVGFVDVVLKNIKPYSGETKLYEYEADVVSISMTK